MKRDEIISFYKLVRTTWNVFDIKIIGSFCLSYHFFYYIILYVYNDHTEYNGIDKDCRCELIWLRRGTQ